MQLSVLEVNNRRSVLAGLVGALVVTAAPINTAHSQGLGTRNAPVEIRIMANEAFSNSWQTQLVPEFNKQFPNVKVVVDGVPYAELLPKMMLDSINADPEYDILVIDDPWVPQLAPLALSRT